MRLPPLAEDALDVDQRAVLDTLRSGPRGAGVGLVGPFGVWVRAPAVGGPTQALGAAVRYGTGLADDLREIAICTVGAHYRAKFEFAAHRALAERAGVDPVPLDRLRDGLEPGLAGPLDLAWRVARSLLERHRLDDALYAEARAALGERGLIELVTTVGYYCLVSLTLNAFEIPLTADMTDPWPGA
ncbi:MAG: carboxymuconolactone decarboxylase family protein [Gammaproteobacteria bacterium]